MAESKYHRLHRFENGATLIYFKHNGNNTTSISCAYIGGASKDKIPGTAHFLEHMMYDASTADQNSKLGIYENAATTREYITFDINTPNSNIEEAFKILKSRLFKTDFDQKLFDHERKAILQEALMYSNSHDKMSDLLGVGSVLDLTGSEKDIKKITINDLKKFQEDNFVSENLVVCVTSSLEFEQIKDLVEDNIVSNAVSDPQKFNDLSDFEKMPEDSYYIYNPDPNQKTVQIRVAFKDKVSEEKACVYRYVDDFMFNDFSGLLLKKFRTEKGLVYTAYMTVGFGIDGTIDREFTILTSKKHAKEAIRTLGEVLDEARNGMTYEQYKNYNTQLSTIEKDRFTIIKNISPQTLLNRYISGEALWFNNPVHKAQDLTLMQINEHLRSAFTNKPIQFIISGDFDAEKVYPMVKVEEILGVKTTDYIYITQKDKYLDMAGNVVKEEEISPNSHVSQLMLIETGKKFTLEQSLLQISNLSNFDKMYFLMNISEAIGIDDLSTSLNQYYIKVFMITDFAKKINLSFDIKTGKAKDKEYNIENVSEEIKNIRKLPLTERVKILQTFIDSCKEEKFKTEKPKNEQKEGNKQKQKQKDGDEMER